VSESDIDMDRCLLGIDDEKACVPEITWTNCAEQMPPDDETEIIIRHVEDKELILTPANEVFYDIDTLYKECWEWTEFTPENGRN
jgi:hypothetical protein